MAGTPQSGDDEPITGINVTPLVDIVLVLLIIFMVTASYIVRPSIPLDLPSAKSAESEKTGLLSVALTRTGELFVDGQAARLEDLPAAVASARARAAEKGLRLNAFVSADRAAPYGAFAAVVDRLRLAGVVDIALDTRPEAIEDPEP